MQHFTDGELTDYVRGLVSAQRTAQIQDHLASCPTCAATAALYHRVSAAAFVLPLPVPPEIVAEAKTLFQPLRPKSLPLRRVPALPVFTDAAGGWAPAGVRSALHSAAALQAVYQWEDFCVVLRSEIQPHTVRVSLIGQVANQQKPLAEPAATQVRLVAGRKIITRTECNPLGEFTLSFVPGERRLHLEIDLPSLNVSMKIPLRAVSPQETKI